MPQPQRILVCPLDWGLGHATRCIPVIRSLLKKNVEVLIAADGPSFGLLQQEFPALQFIRFKGYEISYPASGSMAAKMLFSIPRLLRAIKRENEELKNIVRDHKIDIVISDNRYGCWSKQAKTVFISHQLMLKAPFGESILHRIILSYVRKFDVCWIPDHETGFNLSGDLSHKYKLPPNACFVGALSRFDPITEQAGTEYEIMAIISGPEPQRGIFEGMVSEQIERMGLKALIVRGVPGEKKTDSEKGNVKTVDHLDSNEMKGAILNSAIILCRSGYSSIMDLAALHKKAIFVPTPGQTEQEYLARYFMDNKIVYSQQQKQFDLQEALERSVNYTGFRHLEKEDLLEEIINAILSLT